MVRTRQGNKYSQSGRAQRIESKHRSPAQARNRCQCRRLAVSVIRHPSRSGGPKGGRDGSPPATVNTKNNSPPSSISTAENPFDFDSDLGDGSDGTTCYDLNGEPQLLGDANSPPARNIEKSSHPEVPSVNEEVSEASDVVSDSVASDTTNTGKIALALVERLNRPRDGDGDSGDSSSGDRRSGHCQVVALPANFQPRLWQSNRHSRRLANRRRHFHVV